MLFQEDAYTNLTQGNFFRHIGSILTFAFAGTFISAVSLGLILFLWTRIPLDGFKINFVEAMSVGATLSATDPVTILAIFDTYKVEPKLYTLIFGESILNDAVAIVLFETAQKYKDGAETLGITSLFEAFGIFFGVFFGSLFIGVMVGIVASLTLKFTYVRRYPKTETCLIILVAYLTYFFSNAIHMSGRSSRRFTSIHILTLRRYCIASVLRHLSQALCLPQHVPTHAAVNQVRLPGHFSIVGELHLYLPRAVALYRQTARLQASFHPHHSGRYLCRSLGSRVSLVKSYQRCLKIPPTTPWHGHY